MKRVLRVEGQRTRTKSLLLVLNNHIECVAFEMPKTIQAVKEKIVKDSATWSATCILPLSNYVSRQELLTSAPKNGCQMQQRFLVKI